MLLLALLTLNVYAQETDILYIGDSHSAGPVGEQLYDELAKNHTVVNYSVSSSRPQSWLPKAPNLQRVQCNNAKYRGSKTLPIERPDADHNSCSKKHKKEAVLTPDFSNLI